MWGWWPSFLCYSELPQGSLERGAAVCMCIRVFAWAREQIIQTGEVPNNRIKQTNWEPRIVNIKGVWSIREESRHKPTTVQQTAVYHALADRSVKGGEKRTDVTVRQVGAWVKCADLTRRWALRESLPPTDVTRQVYVPMSPDHVWEMCRVPSGSRRRRGDVFTSITEPLFSHTYLQVCARSHKHIDQNTPPPATHTHAHTFTRNALYSRVLWQ